MAHREKTVDTKIRTELYEEDGISYKYELIMRESKNLAGWKLPLYLISVEMTQSDSSVTSAETPEIFADAGRAIDFFEKLTKNLVTPINLPYVVEDELLK